MKIFCLSLQRSGTKSVGGFLGDNGFNVCSYRNALEHRLQPLWHGKKIEKLLKFLYETDYDAFEDSPWWHGDLYKYVVNNVKDSKFVILERDAARWFDSMVKHSRGKNPGNTFYHSEIYGRLSNLNWLVGFNDNYDLSRDNNLLDITQSRELYIKFHHDYHAEMISYFKLMGFENRLFHAKLESVDWNALAEFVGLDSGSANFSNTHSHKTKKSEEKLKDAVSLKA